MELSNEIKTQLKAIVLDAIIKEFIAKGHNLTGNGIKSLDAQITSDLVGVTISILGEPYMAIQNEGRARGGMPPPKKAIEEWVRRKGLATSDKDVKRAVYFIRKNMVEVGMHSRKKRLDVTKRNYINQGVERISTQMTELVFAGMEKNFQTTIENVFNKTKSTVINL